MRQWWQSKQVSTKDQPSKAITDGENLPHLTHHLNDNLANLQRTFAGSDDVVFHAVTVGGAEACLVYISEMIDPAALQQIEHGISTLAYEYDNGSPLKQVDLQMMKQQFALSRLQEAHDTSLIMDRILSGNTVLLLEGLNYVFLFDTANGQGRSIDEPVTDQVVRGAREGFVESIDTNVMLIRRRLRTVKLQVQYMLLGRETRTRISIVYLKGIAKDGVVEEIESRLRRINIDGILESNYIEQLIQDAPYSPFPTMFVAERPDRICASLLEGKVAILTDGTPFVLTAPAVFVEFLHANEDYYDGAMASTIIRWVRALGLLIASFLPAFYVAITTIHQDLLQTPLLIRIAGYREDLPYPVLVEALFMQLTFELVREAGLRMPKAIGNAVTIVGTLVIGQAAVQAGLVGALMVIVVAVTALTTFILPNYNFMLVVRYSSFPMLILGGIFGFMGIIVGLMFILIHLCNLRSFGVPYLSPISPARKEGWKDVFMRAPWWKMDIRNPGITEEASLKRASDNHPPHARRHQVKSSED
jgi:hypothetical protein